MKLGETWEKPGEEERGEGRKTRGEEVQCTEERGEEGGTTTIYLSPSPRFSPSLMQPKSWGKPGNEVNIHQAFSFPFFQKLIPGNLGNVTSV